MKYTREQVDIRFLTETEKDAAIDFCIKVFMETYTENTDEQNDEFVNAVRRPGYKESLDILGMFIDGKMVAVSGSRVNSNYWAVLYVDKQYQGCGLAGIMIREVIRIYAPKGPIYGLAKHNNLDMYMHMGFVPTEEPRIMGGMKIIPVVYFRLDDYFQKK